MNTLTLTLQVLNEDWEHISPPPSTSSSDPCFIDLTEDSFESSDFGHYGFDEENLSDAAEYSGRNGDVCDLDHEGTEEEELSGSSVSSPSLDGKEEYEIHDKSATTLQDEKVHQIPEPDWQADTAFYILAQLQQNTSTEAEFASITEKTEQTKRLMLARKCRAGTKVRSEPQSWDQEQGI
ncbi:hypothetical protein BU25DRAFT_455901 [Macroventuria anomochaeta]|uniref:Uncharacterized protein n=1 Tax=Macroventuria anomochaeta TaxID=301207 RepID=A0ACB6SC01_9PLEO|nr:uncharacterized protein BU25DRAFT_455901 [Macroventuria anomochaeta]KAF2630839.1 hypothetical protein BU25DRAFT_455901 [Macroventuria anomochaeta]